MFSFAAIRNFQQQPAAPVLFTRAFFRIGCFLPADMVYWLYKNAEQHKEVIS